VSLSPDDEAKAAYWEFFPDDGKPRRRRGSEASSSNGWVLVLGFLFRLGVLVAAGYCLAAPPIAVFVSLEHSDLVGRFSPYWPLLALAPVAILLLAWRSDRWRPRWLPTIVRAMGLAVVSFAAVYVVEKYFAGQVSAFRDPNKIQRLTSILGVITAVLTLLMFLVVCRRGPREPRAADQS
jgi:hypothetical protein